MKKSFNKFSLRAKQVLYFIILALIIIFIIQNKEPVMVKFLFFGFQMPMVIVIIIVFITGFLTAKVFTKKIKNVKNETDEKLKS